jgi:hypothetical protein
VIADRPEERHVRIDVDVVLRFVDRECDHIRLSLEHWSAATPHQARPRGEALEMFKSIAPHKMRPGSKFGHAITWR